MSTWARAATGWGCEAPGVDRLLQLVLDEAEGVAHADLAPGRPAEDRRAVEQHDALDLGLAARLEPAEGADAQHGERIAGARGDGGPGGALGHLGLDLLEDRGEQLALVGELVVERAARDAGRAHDLLGADAGVPALGEERPGGGDRARRGWPRSVRRAWSA